MKVAITSGYFDVLNSEDTRLIKMMRKHTLPDGEPIVLIYDDYSIYKQRGSFPYQRLEERKKNLNYLVRDIIVIRTPNPGDLLKEVIEDERASDNQIIYFSKERDFVGVDIIKALKIPIKYLKTHGK